MNKELFSLSQNKIDAFFILNSNVVFMYNNQLKQNLVSQTFKCGQMKNVPFRIVS